MGYNHFTYEGEVIRETTDIVGNQQATVMEVKIKGS